MACSRGCCATQRDHYRSIRIGASALPNRRANVNTSEAKQARWDRDGAAYRRLRHDGLKPPSIDGSDRLEAVAETSEQVAMGLRHADPDSRGYVRPRALEVFREETGRSALTPDPAIVGPSR